MPSNFLGTKRHQNGGKRVLKGKFFLQGDEWEEKWGEHYWSKGKAQKWADKWGKDGGNVWHEKWGEDYPPGSDACLKYTDRVSLVILLIA